MACFNRLSTKFNCQIIIVLIISLVICRVAFSSPFLIAAEDDAGPWSQQDGTGFANDIVRTSFEAVGVETEILVVPYARCKDMAIKGKAVACFSMSWLPELAGKIVFSEKPLFPCYADYFFSSRKPMKTAKEKNLPKGTVVGVVSGYEYPPAAYSLKDKGILKFEESESEDLNLKKLVTGRIDLALVNHNEMKPAKLLMAKAGVLGQVKRAFRSGTLKSYIGFSIKHPQGEWAREKFNRGYRIISSSDVSRKIEQKWKTLARKELNGLTGNSTKGK